MESPFYETAFLESNFSDSRAIRGDIPIAYETEVVHLDRKRHAYTVNKIPLKDEQNKVRFVIDVWRDTTREKRPLPLEGFLELLKQNELQKLKEA